MLTMMSRLTMPPSLAANRTPLAAHRMTPRMKRHREPAFGKWMSNKKKRLSVDTRTVNSNSNSDAKRGPTDSALKNHPTKRLRSTGAATNATKAVFHELMTNGTVSVASSASEVHKSMQTQMGGDKVVRFNTATSWLAKERKRLGYVVVGKGAAGHCAAKATSGELVMSEASMRKAAKKREPEDYFNKLMQEGVVCVSSTVNEIHKWMQIQIGVESAPKLHAVTRWLSRERKRVEYVVGQDWKAAKRKPEDYLDKLMQEGVVSVASTPKEIHKSMQRRMGVESVPKLHAVSRRLSRERKLGGCGVAGATKGSEEDACVDTPTVEPMRTRLAAKPPTRQYAALHSAKDYFNGLMEQGKINSKGIVIHKMICQHMEDSPVPSPRTVAEWLADKRKQFSHVGRVHGNQETLQSSGELFNELMNQGYAAFKATEIYELMQERLGSRPMPAFKTVQNWLSKERKRIALIRQANEQNHCK